MGFNEIVFGKASGEAEAAEEPDLVAHGYFDIGMADRLLRRDRWLVLGRKGTGKSLLGEKIKQLCDSENEQRSARLIHLADFPYRTFSQLLPSNIEASSRYPTTWSWLLCLLLLDCISGHKGSDSLKNIDANNALQRLRETGLLPTADLQKLVVLSAKSSFREQIPSLLEGMSDKSSGKLAKDVAFLNLVEALLILIKNYAFAGTQYLVIDGLDDILINHNIQYETLTALIFEAQRLNAFFKKEKIEIGVIILCRTDLYEVLPGPNKNKLRQDSALQIDWYDNGSVAEKSSLIDLANLRAKLALKKEVDIFSDFLPRTLPDGKPTLKFLTDLTRHTPRDFLMLLSHIQEAAGVEKPTREHIVNGAKTYSEQYFLPEIKDELVGYVKPGDFEAFLNSLGEIHERRFTAARLVSVAKAFGLSRARVEIMLHALFAASAIGMTWTGEGRQERFEFKFRNPHAVFNPRRTILLHKGMWKALNLA